MHVSKGAPDAPSGRRRLNRDGEEEGEQFEISIEFDLTRCNPEEYEWGDDDDSAWWDDDDSAM